MTLLIILLLALIQGLTEFLPVSSSGHLVIAQSFFQQLKDVDARILLIIILHLCSAFAIILIFWKRFFSSFKKENIKLWWFIIIATVPAGVTGYLLEDYIDNTFSNNILVGINLMITGLVLFIGERFSKENISRMENIGISRAFVIGIAQTFAILPGLSRSGLTISTGFLLGLKKEEAVRFSFFMALPIIFGASFKKLIYTGQGLQAFLPIYYIAGAIVTFVISALSLMILQRITYIKKLWIFSIYCIIAGLLVCSFVA